MKDTLEKVQEHLKKYKGAFINSSNTSYNMISLICIDNSQITIGLDRVWRIYSKSKLVFSSTSIRDEEEFQSFLQNRKVTSMKINKITNDLIINLLDKIQIHLIAINVRDENWHLDNKAHCIGGGLV